MLRGVCTKRDIYNGRMEVALSAATHRVACECITGSSAPSSTPCSQSSHLPAFVLERLPSDCDGECNLTRKDTDICRFHAFLRFAVNVPQLVFEPDEIHERRVAHIGARKALDGASDEQGRQENDGSRDTARIPGQSAISTSSN